ncbi:MAG: hypothetical protein CVU64_03230 [Deltaproteobacteria bacterium HGW-Deltaproteobacteria-21]|nr:MAG: hypothetical protein CVU64_03230 [Deltaproteobacteria bacterium HGW-Deltaproteobacteria-21]
MVEIIGSVLSAVGAGLILHFIIQLHGPVRVRRIRTAGDPLVLPTLELYQTLFPEDDGTNYSAEECLEFMDERPTNERHVDVKNVILVATFKKRVAGFIFAHFYPQKRKAIVSYFAVDRSFKKARVDGVAAKKLTAALKTTLTKEGTCDALFYDVERISPTASLKDRRRKMGRAGVFRAHAKALRLEPREFQFKYLCPRVSMSELAHEQPFVLFCVGISSTIPKELTKAEMIDYLRFVYLDCYGDIYARDDPRFVAHQDYLKEMIAQYEETLPETIRAI